MRGFEENRSSWDCVEGFQPTVPSGARPRREPEKGERGGWYSAHRERGDDSTRARDGSDPQAGLARQSDERGTWVGDCWRAGIADERHRLSCRDAGDKTRRLAMLVVFVQADERLLDLVVRQEAAGPPRVFGRDEVHLAKGPERAKRQVLEVADGGGDDEEGAGHTDGSYNAQLDGVR